MRIKLNITASGQILPFNYQNKLLGTFHKWLGKNDIHDSLSLYSYSWLIGGRLLKNGYNFDSMASWIISIWEPGIAKVMMRNILDKPDMFSGMIVSEIQILDDPDFQTRERFKLLSPVLARRIQNPENSGVKHLITGDDGVNDVLTNTLNNKIKTAGLNGEVNVCFDPEYQNPKTKLVEINGIKNRASMCPVIIEGSQENLLFAWNVGVGHSTGCGFGALC